MTEAPRPPRPEDIRADALKLLELLASDCEGSDVHSWRKCKRCAAVHGIENRMSLSMKLLNVAITELRQFAAQRQSAKALAEFGEKTGASPWT